MLETEENLQCGNGNDAKANGYKPGGGGGAASTKQATVGNIIEELKREGREEAAKLSPAKRAQRIIKQEQALGKINAGIKAAKQAAKQAAKPAPNVRRIAGNVARRNKGLRNNTILRPDRGTIRISR